MKLKGFVYCHWLWLWSFLFYFDIIKISPLFSLCIAFILTNINLLIFEINKNINIYIRLSIILLELCFIIFVYKKRPYILYKEIPINILVFFIYLTILYFNNLTMNKIYFKLIPKKLSKYKNLKHYIGL